MTSSSLRWRRWPGWAATLASLAMLAGSVAAQDASRSAPYRSSASRHAAKQVRVPEEQPAAVAQKPVPKAVRQDASVQPAQHYEPAARQASAAPRTLPARGRTAALRASTRAINTRMQQPDFIDGAEYSEMPHDGEVIVEGDLLPSHSDGGCGDACGGTCGSGACHSGCGSCGQCFECLCLPVPRIPRLQKLEIFGGAHGFTGPPNRGEGGSFGFHEGINWGSEMWLPCRPDCNESWLSAQLGFQATQSNFAGNDISPEDRRQLFVTGGFFRRVDWGLQGGLVIDFMHDEFYYDQIDLAQARGEVSWVFPCRDELGFWFTQGLSGATSQATVMDTPNVPISITESWHATDIYAMFYRHQFEDCNATGRVSAGFTGENDGFIGADFHLPIAERWAIRSDFAYLIPTQGKSTGGNQEESWNVGLSLVWYPGTRTARTFDYHRPLFNVADNGTFMVDRD